MADRFDDTGKNRATSRARGQSRSRGSQHAAKSGARYTSSGSTRQNNSYYSRKPDDNGLNYGIIIGGVVAAVIVVVGLFGFFNGGFGGGSGSNTIEESTLAATEALDPNSIHDDIYIDVSSFAPGAELININGMNREQARAAIEASYNWNLVVKNTNPSLDSFKMPELTADETTEETTADAGQSQDDDGTEQTVEVDNPYSGITIRPEAASFAVPDLIAANLDEMIEQIFKDYEQKAAQDTESDFQEESAETSAADVAKADYALALPDFSTQITDYIDQLATVWKMSPKNGDITSYDSSSGEFVFGGSVDGYEINAQATAAKVMEAINNHKYDAAIDADGSKISASISSIKDKYEIIGSFSTETTSNSVRNGNIKRAAAAINGTVLQPGEEFSFNETVGQRTEEKGYGGAAAYNEGEVVTEVGGGVCQVSSTLYNAVFRAGLTTTYRRSHTFAPTYVTPGTDATVSWPGPDYKFVNNSDHAIGIITWYENQTMNAQIYGIRILPEGVSWELVSEKATDLPIPAAEIITEGEESEGTAGSEWQAYKVIHNADGTTEKVKDHYTHYSGHTPKKYSPEIAASLAAEAAATAATDENGETIVSSSDGTASESSSGESEDTDAQESDEDTDEEVAEETSHETIDAGPSAPISNTQAEGPVAQFGDVSVDDGLISDGPVVNG